MGRAQRTGAQPILPCFKQYYLVYFTMIVLLASGLVISVTNRMTTAAQKCMEILRRSFNIFDCSMSECQSFLQFLYICKNVQKHKDSVPLSLEKSCITLTKLDFERAGVKSLTKPSRCAFILTSGLCLSLFSLKLHVAFFNVTFLSFSASNTYK